ncbi:MAG: MATE family efflux transporter [Treponema sp.]|nr:MATE family efflux transporter [Treponema sp.]
MSELVEKYKYYLNRLLIIAVPMILSQLINQVQMLIDRIFLGHANSLYMSVLGNATFPMWTTMSFCFSIGTGASILISQSVGAEDKEKVSEYAGSLLKFNTIIPFGLFIFWGFFSEPVFRLMGVSENLIPMCVDYARYYSPVFILAALGSIITIFQTSNYTKPLATYSLIRSVLNVIFDWILIFGKFGFPALGVKGAALGTTLAEFIAAIYFAYAYVKAPLITKPSFTAIKTARIKSYLYSAKLGINTALEDFLWNIGNLVLIRILNTINELAAGIYSIIFGVEVLAVVAIGSLGSGAMTLTSEATGKHDIRQYRGVCQCAYAICSVITVVMIITGILFPEQILSIFTKDASIIATSSIYLLMIAINLFSKSGNIIIGNCIRGSGNTRWMFMTQIFGTVFVICMACIFVFAFKMGITGVFLAVLTDEAVRAVINYIRYRKICTTIEKPYAPVTASA